jgi:hypothetical protein
VVEVEPEPGLADEAEEFTDAPAPLPPEARPLGELDAVDE